MNRLANLFPVLVAILILQAGAAETKTPDILPQLIARYAPEVDFSKPLDLLVEGAAEQSLATPEKADVNRPKGEAEPFKYSFRLLSRAGEPAFRFEMGDVNKRFFWAVGHPLKGSSEWYVDHGTLSKQLPCPIVGREAAVLRALIDVVSLAPLARAPKTEGATVGPKEEVSLPGAAPISVRPLNLQREDLKVEALLAADEAQLIGARLRISPNGAWCLDTEMTVLCLFDDFRKENGLLFPMQWQLAYLRGDMTMMSKVKFSRVAALPDLSPEPEWYALEKALLPLSLPQGALVAPSLKVPAERIKRLPPELRVRMATLLEEAAQVDKNYKVGSEKWQEACTKLEPQFAALAKEIRAFTESHPDPGPAPDAKP